MPRTFELKKFSADRGDLVVVQSELPFQIKRVFYIFDVPPGAARGGHRHKVTQLALICPIGSCDIDIDNGLEKKMVRLDEPTTCLLLAPEDFHYMRNFAPQTVLLVLASTEYNQDDYIFEAHKK